LFSKQKGGKNAHDIRRGGGPGDGISETDKFI